MNKSLKIKSSSIGAIFEKKFHVEGDLEGSKNRRVIFPDIIMKLPKLLDPADVNHRVKLCMHTKF